MSTRSRLASASSSGLADILLPPPPSCARITIPSKTTRNHPKPAEQRPGIFSVSSPTRETSSDRRGEEVIRRLCGFLETCCYCRKLIPRDIDIFMYSNLQAFCSEDCRQKRIDIDKDLEMLSLDPKVKPKKNEVRFITKSGK